MSIYNVILSQLASDLLPPKKRDEALIAKVSGLLSAWYRRSKSLKEFKEGSQPSEYPAYSAGTYNQYDTVTYEKATYECQIDGTTTEPTDKTSWLQLNKSFIGTNDSQLFNAGKLVLEYALNTYFGTTFNQPPTLSDIYINNTVSVVGTFRVGGTFAASSTVGQTVSPQFVPLTYSSGVVVPMFAINIPSAFYASLGPDAEQIVRNYADKYVATSIPYEIITY